METSMAVFRGKEIRKTTHNNEWWFSIVDVVSALTDSVDPGGYIKDMRRRDEELSKGWGQIATPLSIQTDGGPQKINCANTEGIFRIIQSIPSPKAEPFKRWLAKVGYERVQEIENPELVQERMKQLYELKGYPKDWIDKRLRGIAIRQNLTDEWKERGIETESVKKLLLKYHTKKNLTPSIKTKRWPSVEEVWQV
jgi:prophage antirepressor-like protein